MTATIAYRLFYEHLTFRFTMNLVYVCFHTLRLSRRVDLPERHVVQFPFLRDSPCKCCADCGPVIHASRAARSTARLRLRRSTRSFRIYYLLSDTLYKLGTLPVRSPDQLFCQSIGFSSLYALSLSLLSLIFTNLFNYLTLKPRNPFTPNLSFNLSLNLSTSLLQTIVEPTRSY